MLPRQRPPQHLPRPRPLHLRRPPRLFPLAIRRWLLHIMALFIIRPPMSHQPCLLLLCDRMAAPSVVTLRLVLACWVVVLLAALSLPVAVSLSWCRLTPIIFHCTFTAPCLRMAA